MTELPVKIQITDFNLRYSDGTESLRHITLPIYEHQINVLFGPGGGGKSSLLRAINRLNDLVDVEKQTGKILLDGEDIYAVGYDVIALRRRVGMVFARPVPLPMTIYENITYALELAGERDRMVLDGAVERCLTQAALWEEVYERLHSPAYALSGGQQQRLCLARSLALEPEVIMLDEPTSGLDPISTAKVEITLQRLKETYTIIIVPHSVQQAARVADWGAFFLQGELVEQGPGRELFLSPQDKRTEDYITGRFG
ncbi:MAG TPA: phosphate ABC transporter ATP-binding protein [Chloroflexi bacterium]|mgnify:CR=1 FL=1|nr:phosphate ABC transporter ATP-binding protein [Chloroflexota bacterium]